MEWRCLPSCLTSVARFGSLTQLLHGSLSDLVAVSAVNMPLQCPELEDHVFVELAERGDYFFVVCML